ncbi:MAG: glycosyltransferase family 39 protein [Chloroflexi bacterium]|nr:glycosyltransferase family 39 protein [Chloroflexota bacterium]MCL5076433.1 glycosyltransferase family 39 protein [Chloroflexota bacterium]
MRALITNTRLRWLEIGLLLTIILLLAAPLRLYAIDTIPPGLSLDEAAEGLDAQRILVGWLPVFLPSNNGREALFAYVVATVFQLFGPTAAAIRLAAAILGILTVPATYLMVRALFGRRVAVLTAIFLSISYWHVSLSRLGLRTVALPLLGALALYFLWQALGSNRVWCWIMAGVSLGLSLYTYAPARLLPPLLAVAVLLWLVTHRKVISWPSRIPGVLLCFIVAGLVFAPLVLYFWAHPTDFLGRAEQVSLLNAVRAGADWSAVLTGNIAKTLGMFLWQGDLNPRHNLPGRAVFDPLLGGLFVVGLGLAVWRARQVEYGLSLLWLAVMLTPSILSDSAPHALRAAGVLPLLFVLPAIAMVAAWDKLQKWLPLAKKARILQATGMAAVVLLAVIEGGWTARDYFGRWAGRPDTGDAFNVAEVTLADYLNQLPASTRVYVGPLARDHPTVRFLTKHWEMVRPFPASCLPLPETASTDVIYLLGVSPDPGRIRRYFPQGNSGPTVEDPYGRPVFRSYFIPAGTRLQSPPAPSHSLRVSLGEEIELLGYDLDGTLRAGENLSLTLYWRARRAPLKDYTIFIHLVDEDGHIWSQRNSGPGDGDYPTSYWDQGEVVIDRHTLPIPSDAVPDTYNIVIGMYPEGGGARLGIQGATGRDQGNQLVLASVHIARAISPPDPARLPIGRRMEAAFRPDERSPEQIRLLGYTLETARVLPGRAIRLILFWQVLGKPAEDYTVLVRGRDEKGTVAFEEAVRPVRSRYPTVQWEAGEIVRDEHDVLVGARVRPGGYHLTVALYKTVSEEPLRAVLAGQELDEIALPDGVQMEALERTFAIPPIQNQLTARFGEAVQFLGYDLTPVAVKGGGSLELTLYWQAIREMETSYTVFTHLLDAQERIWGQKDDRPVGGARPTTSWARGEVIIDRYEIAVKAGAPPGEYRLEIGMYDAVTGQRLPVYGQDSRSLGDRLLLAPVLVEVR